MKHAYLPGTIHEDLTPEVREREWLTETRPNLADLVPLPEPPPPELTGQVLPPRTDHQLAATLALAYLVGEVTAAEATGREESLNAYTRAIGRARGPITDETLEAAAAGDMDAEREIIHATAGSRSLRNLVPYARDAAAVVKAAAIMRYAPPGNGDALGD